MRLRPYVLSALLLAACNGGTGDTAAPNAARTVGGAVPVAIAEIDHESFRSSPLGSYLAAQYARTTRDTTSAAALYEVALENDPDNPALSQLAFLMHLSEGRFDRAGEIADEQSKRNIRSVFTRLFRVAVAGRAGRDELALEQFEDFPRPRGFAVLLPPLLQAWLTLENDGYEAARPLLKQLLEAPVIDAITETILPYEHYAANGRRFDRQVLAMKARNVGEQVAAFHEALMADLAGRDADADAAFRVMFKGSGGGTSRTLLAYADYLARRGDGEKALGVLERYLKQFPGSQVIEHARNRMQQGEALGRLVSDSREGLAEAFFTIAGLAVSYRRYDSAKIYLRLALHLRPDFDPAKILLANVLEDHERETQAIAIYRSVNPASPLSRNARIRLASLLDKQDRTDEARQVLHRLAAERPEDNRPLVALGDLLRAKKRYREAVVEYDAAVARIDEARERDWVLFYVRGIALERLGEWPRAEADFQQALELRPGQPSVLNYLGYSWVDRGLNLDEAKEMIEEAVAKRPDDGYIVDSLGWVLYRLGDFKGAVRHLERAVSLRPQDPLINDHLGDAYWRVGRRLEARFQWNHALSLGIDDDQVETVEDKLKFGLDAVESDASGG